MILQKILQKRGDGHPSDSSDREYGAQLERLRRYEWYPVQAVVVWLATPGLSHVQG